MIRDVFGFSPRFPDWQDLSQNRFLQVLRVGALGIGRVVIEICGNICGSYGASIAMEVPPSSLDGFFSWEHPSYKWMMTGGSPMTKRKPPDVLPTNKGCNVEQRLPLVGWSYEILYYPLSGCLGTIITHEVGIQCLDRQFLLGEWFEQCSIIHICSQYFTQIYQVAGLFDGETNPASCSTDFRLFVHPLGKLTQKSNIAI